MLRSLRIRNLALLEEVELDFDAGFTAVTGETGAGKSILLGALSLLAGERADKSVVRQGAAACEVEAALHFERPERLDRRLADLGLPACEDGVLLLKRSVAVDRPGKISVNGSLATLAALQQLGEAWIDFHGPSEPRRLLKDSCQLELLDLYGRAGEDLAGYQAAYAAWRDAEADRDRLAAEARLAPDQVEFLRHQVRQFAAVDLSAEGIEDLERNFLRMSRAQELSELADALAGGLTGEDGVQSRLAALLRDARRLAELDSGSRSLAERLSAAAGDLHELAAEFSALVENLQFDPGEAGQLTARMNAWLELKRRHGADPAEVRAARDAIARRLEAQTDFAAQFEERGARAAAAERTARAQAQVLRRRREKAAHELARAAGREIAGLGFAKAGFDVRVVPTAGTVLGPTGDCTAEFQFAPNVGEEPRPLQRIASSGELARVMLALKAILAEWDDVPVLVFDEVDANVGGEIGRVVGEKLAAIGRRRQVLCVTHLPQVAAQAANHLVVTKDQAQGRAVVGIRAVQGERRARVIELARMLGDRQAKSALAHAEELLGR
jgi:DNA repair protein RecN (Recombination protein N)